MWEGMGDVSASSGGRFLGKPVIKKMPEAVGSVSVCRRCRFVETGRWR